MSCCGNCLKIQILSTVPNMPSNHLVDGKLYLDLHEEFHLEFSKKLEELSEIDQIADEAILNTSVKYTPINNIIGEPLRNHNLIGNSNPIIQVLIQEGNIIHQFKEIEFVGADDRSREYNIRIKRGSEHWARTANRTYLKEIPWGSFNFTQANVINNWSASYRYTDGDLGVYFPLVNYGGWFDPDSVVLEDFRPWFHALSGLQKGMCALGWSFRCPWLETDEGRQVITYISDNSYAVNRDELTLKEFSATITPNTVLPGALSQLIIFDTEIFDNGNNYDPTTGEFQEKGVYDITVRVKVVINVPFLSEPNPLHLELWKRTSGGIGQNVGKVQSEAVGENEIVEIELKLERATLLDGEFFYVVITGAFTELEVIEGVYYNRAERFVYSDGDIINLADVVGNYTFLQYFKGCQHMCDGKLVTDHINKTVWLYTPYDTEWYETQINGFYLDTIDDITALIEQDSEQTLIERRDELRFVRLQFKNSKDRYISKLDLPEDEPLYHKLVDRGTAYKEGTTLLKNPFFEPTANDFLDRFPTIAPVLTNSPIDIPVVWDNDKGEISYDVGPRVLITIGDIAQRDDGPLNQVRNWRFEGSLRQALPYAFQVPNSKKNDGFSAVAITERLVYGEDPNDLYNLAYKRSLLGSIYSVKSGFLAKWNSERYKNTDFRGLYKIYYNGRTFLGRLLEVNNKLSCSNESSNIIVKPEPFIGDVCSDTISIPDDGCNNQPRINGNANPATDEISATADNTGINSTIDTDTWEYSLDDGVNWTPYTPGNTISGQSNVLFRRTVTFTDSCPDKVVTRLVEFSTSCNNNPTIEITYDESSNTISATGGGTFNSSIDTDTWDVSVDGGSYSSYTPGTDITGFMEVRFRRITTFTNSCPDIMATNSFTVTGDQCNNQPIIEFTEISPCVYDLSLAGSTTSDVYVTNFYISKDGGTSFKAWDNRPITGDPNTVVRAMVYYCDSCQASCIETTCPFTQS